MSDVRAVSTTLSYVLALAIATLLITGLITAGGTYVDSQREQVIRDELRVVGQQIAADVERSDRLVRAADSDDPTITLNRTLSNRVTGASYELTLVPSDQTLVVNTTRPDVTVRIGLTVETPLGATSARGGDIQIRYDQGADHLEVRNV
ncbi:DUF7266 family protein [Haloarcula salinisoli]|uniref:Uncharacterized protein n=1 Tax=Haloarcula salinisoli TaxID=2487746 RepID=A0A8J7YM03_9EURY|nr:hypothetical protein [Halomicroarcula salinisoli]MBX0284869.1 hypothetical protein [Halomicroarcula salinisoli]MBX0303653.1 hypothetical protein [Halomicroarcula salinisoli]